MNNSKHIMLEQRLQVCLIRCCLIFTIGLIFAIGLGLMVTLAAAMGLVGHLSW